MLIDGRAAATSHCSTNASSVACMACSMERPAFALGNGVAPIGALLLPCLTQLLCQPLLLAHSLISTELACRRCKRAVSPP